MRYGVALFVLAACSALEAQRPGSTTVYGDWEGTITARSQQRRIRLTFSTDSGRPRGWVDLPHQYALRYPLANVGVRDAVVSFEFPATLPSARFDLVRQGGKLVGAFESIQGRDTILGAVDLRIRSATRAPYRAEEIRFQNGEAQLRGTLFLPRTKARSPAVVFVHGSGPQTRDSYLRYFADQFARAGFVALIYDKRNTGRLDIPIWLQGGGSFSEFADDALAAVRLLRSRSEVDSTRIGIWGLSQGAWVGTLAASRDTSIAFAILLSGGGVTPAEAELYDDEIKLREAGYSQAAIDTAMTLLRTADEYVRSGSDSAWSRIEASRTELRPRRWFALLDRFPLTMPRDAPVWSGLRTDLDYDPRPALEKLRIPVLLILGTADELTPAAETERRVRAAFARSGNQALTVSLLPDADHGLFSPPRGVTWLEQAPVQGWVARMLQWSQSMVFVGPLAPP
jgi:dienelactone hydrolase